jgi:FAD binding domain
MDRATRIAILGAGLAGLTTAGLLQRAGFSVAVYEQSPSFSRIGAGIILGANVAKVLRRLDLERRLTATGIRPDAFLSRTWDTGETTYQLVFDAACEARFDGPFVNIHRADLHELLKCALAPGTSATATRSRGSTRPPSAWRCRSRTVQRGGRSRDRCRRYPVEGARKSCWASRSRVSSAALPRARCFRRIASRVIRSATAPNGVHQPCPPSCQSCEPICSSNPSRSPILGTSLSSAPGRRPRCRRRLARRLCPSKTRLAVAKPLTDPPCGRMSQGMVRQVIFQRRFEPECCTAVIAVR